MKVALLVSTRISAGFTLQDFYQFAFQPLKRLQSSKPGEIFDELRNPVTPLPWSESFETATTELAG